MSIKWWVTSQELQRQMRIESFNALEVSGIISIIT